MSNNRELSQLASLITVDDSDRSIGITTSVGIGTTNPTSKLNVVDNSSSDAVRITQLGAGNAFVVEDSTNPDITPFVINAGGSVGIGTTNPSRAVHLFKSGTGTSNLDQAVFRAENLSSVDSYASFNTVSDTVTINLQANSSTRTSPTRLGQVVGGWGELYSTSGNGLLIGNSHSAPIIIGTNDTEALRIDSSQRVGIGTTNPNELLDIHGGSPVRPAAIRLTDDDDGSYSRLSYNRTASVAILILEVDALNQNPNVSKLSFRVGGTNVSDEKVGISSLLPLTVGLGGTIITATSGGFVGIGTTNPTQKLQVYDGSVNVYRPTGEVNIQVESGDTSVAAFRAISPYRNWRFGIQGGANADFVIRDATDSKNRLGITSAGEVIIGSNLTPLVPTGTASQTLQVTGGAYISGNLGIGTTNPSEEVHLFNSQNSGTVVRIENTNTGSGANASLRTFADVANVNFNVYSSTRTSTGYGITQPSFGELSLITGNGFQIGTKVSSPLILGTNNTEVIRIDSSQNVGIGTTNPAAKLHIEGGSATAGGEHNLIVRSSIVSIIPTTITTSSSSGTLQVFGGGMASGSRRGGQIDFVAGAATTNPGTLIFRTGTDIGGTSTPERVRITSTGNVGIGTTNPNGKLEVLDANNKRAILINNDSIISIGSSDSDSYGVAHPGTAKIKLSTFADDGSVLSSTMTGVNAYTSRLGELIIEGTTPGVAKAAGQTWGIRFHQGDGTGNVSDRCTAAIHAVRESTTTGATSLDFKVRAASGNLVTRQRINSSGNLLIGSTTDTGTTNQLLQVNGRAHFADSVGIGTTNALIGIGNSEYRTSLYIVNTIDDSSVEGAYSMVIDTWMNGTIIPPAADAEQAGLYIKTRSDVTAGNTSNEHQVYGLRNQLDVNGDSDVVYGMFNAPSLYHSSGTVSSFIGVNNSITNRATSTVTSFYGDYNVASDLGTGTVTTHYAQYNIAQPGSGSSGTRTSTVASRNRVNFAAGSAVSPNLIIATWANLDNDAGVTQASNGLAALLYGTYDTTTGYNNPYGVYIPSNVTNYFRGPIGIAITNPGSGIQISNSSDELAGIRLTNSTALVGDLSATGWLLYPRASNALISASGFSIRKDSNNDAITINTSNNVGIRTDNPGAALDVQGSIYIRDTTGNSTFTSPGNLAIKDNASDPYISFHESTGTRNAYIQSVDTTGLFVVQEDAFPLVLRTELSQSIIFETANVEEMRITGAGLVGIGITNPTSHLYVSANIASEYAATFFNDGNSTNRFGIRIQCGADTTSGTAIAINDGDGTNQGNVTFSAGTVTYGAFTANHDCIIPSYSEEIPYGTLMTVDRILYKKRIDGTEMERGIVYESGISTTVYSKNLLGAYSYQYDENSPVQEGNDLPMHQVLVLGDGHIRCCGETGNIKIGDGITSSSIAGVGMKMNKIGMVIGIAQEDVDFTDANEVKLVPVQYGLHQYIPDNIAELLENMING